uniref:Uncharacterized protein n=1 Tax=Romanomermis culicivorax TaxID=13658 RepID=A0A915IQF6_ROMCU
YFTILQAICCFDCIILVKFWSCQHGRFDKEEWSKDQKTQTIKDRDHTGEELKKKGCPYNQQEDVHLKEAQADDLDGE